MKNGPRGPVFLFLVGAAGFEPTTPCPPGRCATRLRYAPTWFAIRIVADGLLALQNLQDFFQFHAHLAHDLVGDAHFHLVLLAIQALAGASNREALIV